MPGEPSNWIVSEPSKEIQRQEPKDEYKLPPEEKNTKLDSIIAQLKNIETTLEEIKKLIKER